MLVLINMSHSTFTLGLQCWMDQMQDFRYLGQFLFQLPKQCGGKLIVCPQQILSQTSCTADCYFNMNDAMLKGSNWSKM